MRMQIWWRARFETRRRTFVRRSVADRRATPKMRLRRGRPLTLDFVPVYPNLY